MSTSPDQDARFAIAVLRGALALPTRGFLRDRAGNVASRRARSPRRRKRRSAARCATRPSRSCTATPRSSARRSLRPSARWPCSCRPTPRTANGISRRRRRRRSAARSRRSRWTACRRSSAGTPAAGEWTGARGAARTRGDPARRSSSGRDDAAPHGDRQRRRASGAGAFAAVRSADAYAALWGGIFDWLAAERADRRGAVPGRERHSRGPADPVAPRIVRRLARPAAASSRAAPALRRAATRLRFGSRPDRRSQETRAAAARCLRRDSSRRSRGARGQRACRTAAAFGRGSSPEPLDVARAPARLGAPGVLALSTRSSILLLCAEWILRRRAGLR